MQRSLTVADVNFVSLQTAVFCVQCEMLSDNNTPRCLACGSGAVLSLSRVLGGSLRGQQTTHLIADAELDRLVRSLLYTVPQIAADEEQIDARKAAIEFFLASKHNDDDPLAPPLVLDLPAPDQVRPRIPDVGNGDLVMPINRGQQGGGHAALVLGGLEDSG